MILECPKCKAELADVVVHKPFTAAVHCGMCGVDFGASLRPEEKEAAPAPVPDPDAMPPEPHTAT